MGYLLSARLFKGAALLRGYVSKCFDGMMLQPVKTTSSAIDLSLPMAHAIVFFLGVTEFSSLFLVIVDMAKFFPPSEGTIYDTLLAVSGPLFAVTFTLYRVVLWWQVSLLLWQDCYHVVTKGISNKLRPGKNFVLYIFLFLNIPLGFLQLYWFTLILGEVQKVLAAAM